MYYQAAISNETPRKRTPFLIKFSEVFKWYISTVHLIQLFKSGFSYQIFSVNCAIIRTGFGHSASVNGFKRKYRDYLFGVQFVRPAIRVYLRRATHWRGCCGDRGSDGGKSSYRKGLTAWWSLYGVCCMKCVIPLVFAIAICLFVFVHFFKILFMR